MGSDLIHRKCKYVQAGLHKGSAFFIIPQFLGKNGMPQAHGDVFSCLSGFVMHHPRNNADRVLPEALAPIDDMLYAARRVRAGSHDHRFLTPVRRADPESPLHSRIRIRPLGSWQE